MDIRAPGNAGGGQMEALASAEVGHRRRDVSSSRKEQGLSLLSSFCGMAGTCPDSGGIIRKGHCVGGGCQWKGL